MGRHRRDPKLDSLQLANALHAHADRVCDALFKDSRFFDPRDLVLSAVENRVNREGPGEGGRAR